MTTQRSKDYVSQTVKDIFDEMDHDDNNSVTMIEFRDYINSKGNGLEGIAQIFCDCDTSDDQKVTLDELNEMLTAIPPEKIDEGHVKAVFDKFNTSGGDKFLDKAEFRAMMAECGQEGDWVDELCDKVAGDDGKISLEEFIKQWHSE